MVYLTFAVGNVIGLIPSTPTQPQPTRRPSLLPGGFASFLLSLPPPPPPSLLSSSFPRGREEEEEEEEEVSLGGVYRTD